MREFYRAREPEQTLLPVDLNRLVLQVLDLTRARWSNMAQARGAVHRAAPGSSPPGCPRSSVSRASYAMP